MISLNIWILQTGEPLHIDGGNVRPMRAMNLSNKLVNTGHNVVLWSSAFYHQEKCHRSLIQQSIRVSDNLEIRLIPSRGYQHNIGLGRLIDHAQLALNLIKMLIKYNDVPDVAFIGYPPIETAVVMVHWLSKYGVPSLLDIKDQWPLLFLCSLPTFLKPFGRVILWPYFYLAKRAMLEATGLSAMANGFLNWALTFSGRTRTDNDCIFPLTSPSENVATDQLEKARRWWDSQGVLDNGRPRICFIGSHSRAFDFRQVYEAAKMFSQISDNCQFVICGDGECSFELHSMMNGLPNVYFPGWIDRPRIVALAERSIASLAPYSNTEDFLMSIPNKIIDALYLSLPILSSLQGEVASLIIENGVGMCYGAGTGKSLYDCIQILVEYPSMQKSMSQKARALYEDRFSFEIVYGGLVKHLENMV